jgi:hypothetical protein
VLIGRRGHEDGGRTEDDRVCRCGSAMTTEDRAREVNGGGEPSTRHPPLRALARRVDRVLMAMSPPTSDDEAGDHDNKG